jgi:hypothetical protein
MVQLFKTKKVYMAGMHCCLVISACIRAGSVTDCYNYNLYEMGGVRFRTCAIFSFFNCAFSLWTLIIRVNHVCNPSAAIVYMCMHAVIEIARQR